MKNDLLLTNNHHILRLMQTELKNGGKQGKKSTQAQEAFLRVSENLEKARN